MAEKHLQSIEAEEAVTSLAMSMAVEDLIPPEVFLTPEVTETSVAAAVAAEEDEMALAVETAIPHLEAGDVTEAVAAAAADQLLHSVADVAVGLGPEDPEADWVVEEEEGGMTRPGGKRKR